MVLKLLIQSLELNSQRSPIIERFTSLLMKQPLLVKDVFAINVFLHDLQ